VINLEYGRTMGEGHRATIMVAVTPDGVWEGRNGE
jgi:hypothetical protein